jgi:small conductance mechanosensitive channel
LFGSILVTPGNVMTMVGNGKVFGETIQNFSNLPAQRVQRTAYEQHHASRRVA